MHWLSYCCNYEHMCTCPLWNFWARQYSLVIYCFHGIQGSSMMRRPELREASWMKLKDQLCARLLLVFYGNPKGKLGVLSSGSHCHKYLQRLSRLFIQLGCGSQCLHQESWELEFLHLRNALKHRKSNEWYGSVASAKQNSSPHGFNLKKLSSQLSLSCWIPIYWRKHAFHLITPLSKVLLFCPHIIYIRYSICYRN